MPIAIAVAIQWITQRLRFIFETTIGCIVDVKARHFIKAYDSVNGLLLHIRLQPIIKLLIATVIGPRFNWPDAHIKTFWNLTLPNQRIHTNVMATLLALQGNAHKIALQATKGEVFIEDKSQLHQPASLSCTLCCISVCGICVVNVSNGCNAASTCSAPS